MGTNIAPCQLPWLCHQQTLLQVTWEGWGVREKRGKGEREREKEERNMGEEERNMGEGERNMGEGEKRENRDLQ